MKFNVHAGQAPRLSQAIAALPVLRGYSVGLAGGLRLIWVTLYTAPDLS